MTTTKVTDATVEPLTTAEAKTHLRETLVDAANDAYIALLVKVCRTAAEDASQRTLITTTWLLTLDAFPCGVARYGQVTDPAAIQLAKPPVIAVTWVKYRDVNGVLQTLASSAYQLDVATGQVTPATGTSWPSTWSQPGGVQVQYTAGYGADASFVPAPIVHWIKLALTDLYENRSRSAERPAVPQDFADGLIDSYRVVGL